MLRNIDLSSTFIFVHLVYLGIAVASKNTDCSMLTTQFVAYGEKLTKSTFTCK